MKYENIKKTTTENSEVEISGEITVEAITSYRKKALKEIGENLNIPGFRKGHIPEKVLVDRVGEIYILEEAAELALKEIAPEVIEKEAPNFVGRPQIALTKIAPGNPVGFKITIGFIPEVKLPDYKKIAKTEMSKAVDKLEVTDKEIDDVIEQVRKQEAHRSFHAANAGDTSHNHSEEALKEHLPEFTDEFVKKLGSFESVADFRTKAKENTLKEKEHRALEKRRGELLEKVVAETELKLPPALVENELSRMFAQFEGDIQKIGLKVEDYLKHIKKTPEDLRKEWLPDAEKRAKLNVILEEIAKKENLTPDQEAVKVEVANLTKQYKDIDPIRAQVYVEHMFTIEKAIKFLEEQK
ncbi:hypothetical protein H0W32_00810 [Patescibacteria group bacterium]|nr:hypothetical protein [Patescibacteria group bacterium]